MVTIVRECRPFGKKFSTVCPNDPKVRWLVHPKVGLNKHFLHEYNKTGVKPSFTHLLTFNEQIARQTRFVLNELLIEDIPLSWLIKTRQPLCINNQSHNTA